MFVMSAHTSGRSNLGLSTLPRSPPVHVTTSTSTPSATYFAMVAAPLLDSSSGCAWTAMRRSCSATCGAPRLGPTGADLPAGRPVILDSAVTSQRSSASQRRAGKINPAILADAADNDARRYPPVTETHATVPPGAPVFPPGRYGHRREPRRRPALAVLLAVALV